MKKVILLMTVALLFPTACFARHHGGDPSWFPLGKDTNHDHWYIDINKRNIRKDSYYKNTIDANIKIEHDGEEQTLQNISCLYPSMEYAIVYNVGGSYRSTWAIPLDKLRYSPVNPGSMQEKICQFLTWHDWNTKERTPD